MLVHRIASCDCRLLNPTISTAIRYAQTCRYTFNIRLHCHLKGLYLQYTLQLCSLKLLLYCSATKVNGFLQPQPQQHPLQPPAKRPHLSPGVFGAPSPPPVQAMHQVPRMEPLVAPSYQQPGNNPPPRPLRTQQPLTTGTATKQ